MPPTIDITSSQVAKLDDEQLRELVAKLCSAELTAAGLPLSALTHGGNQTASDGGVDVRVETSTAVCLDFIKRPLTLYQVKCEDMPPRKIAGEMMPGGTLRQAIVEAVSLAGAYILVTSKGTVADGPLRARRQAMREAIATVPRSEEALVDVYDRTRLAEWVNRHSGVALWLRAQINEPLSGWRGFGRWSRQDVPGPLLTDAASTMRVRSPSRIAESVPVMEGLALMRDALRAPSSVVRLVGLAGIGKSRLAQALFEQEVGGQALDQAVAIYCDEEKGPEPRPAVMLQHAGANQQRTIAIIDNCRSRTHAELMGVVSSYPSCLSLMTIEYDVNEDDDELTEVYELKTCSEDVIVALIVRRNPGISTPDAQRVAEISGGNPLLALSIAGTLKRDTAIGQLTDRQLFERLFHQNNHPDPELLRAAQACSLFYSFAYEPQDGQPSELEVLAALADLTVRQLHRELAKLVRRDLIQRRSRWGALLPHALANRLASQALKEIPRDTVLEQMQSHTRLLVSFARRLSFLHQSSEAVHIARRLLESATWVRDPLRINEQELNLLLALAPTDPMTVLQTLESIAASAKASEWLQDTSSDRIRWIHLLRSLAYEPEMFSRAARILFDFARAEVEGHGMATDSWKNLFALEWSGTMAAADVRFGLLWDTLTSGDVRNQIPIFQALDIALDGSNHHVLSMDLRFGARSRSFGLAPQTIEDLVDWYRRLFDLMERVAGLNATSREQVRRLVARAFGRLWNDEPLRTILADLMRMLSDPVGWAEGWVAVQLVAHELRGNDSPSPALLELEEILRPSTLHERIRAYVNSTPHLELDVAQIEGRNNDAGTRGDAHERVVAIAEDLGQEASRQLDALPNILVEQLSVSGGNQFAFGRGLAAGAPDPIGVWAMLTEALALVAADRRNFAVISGFLASLRARDSELYYELLTNAVDDDALGPYFPFLQGTPEDATDVARLMRALHRGAAPVHRYVQLAFGAQTGIAAAEYIPFIEALSSTSGGLPIALTVASSTLFQVRGHQTSIPVEFANLSRRLLARTDFSTLDARLLAHAKHLVSECLVVADGDACVAEICAHITDCFYTSGLPAIGVQELLCLLCTRYPNHVLDALFGVERSGGIVRRLLNTTRSRRNPLDSIPAETLTQWIQIDASRRAPLLAGQTGALMRVGRGLLDWTPLARIVLREAPDMAAVLEAFSGSLLPRATMDGTEEMLGELDIFIAANQAYPDPAVVFWLEQERLHLRQSYAARQRSSRDREESFED